MYFWWQAVCSWLPCYLSQSRRAPHSRQYANEAAAVSRRRGLTTLEKTFAAAHADKGLLCEVQPLKSGKEESLVEYDHPLFLITGTYAGYKFVLGNCRTDAKGVVVHFEATAVPVERARRAFVHSVLMILVCSGLTRMGLRQTA